MTLPKTDSRLLQLGMTALLSVLLTACNSSAPSRDANVAADLVESSSGSPSEAPLSNADESPQRCTEPEAGSDLNSDCANADIRALWVWGSQVVFEPSQEQQLFDLAEQKSLNRIYLAAIQALRQNQTALARFFQRAEQRGISVELLFGQPDWALPENHHQVMSIIDQVTDFAERFPDITVAGIHLDVEPYLLPEWDNDRQSLGNAFIDLLEAARSRANKASLPLLADIPVWYDEHGIFRNGRARTLHELVIDATDGVGLMDYRDSSQRIINDASVELAYASSAQKPVVVGVETLCIEPSWITFCEEGSTFLEQTLATVNRELKRYSAYQGYAIHHFDSYLELHP